MTDMTIQSPEALQDAFVAALAANDAAAVAACYAQDALSYAMDEMAGVGPDFVRDSWSNFFSVYTIMEIGLYDTHMAISGDIAASWGLFRMLVEIAGDGEEIELHGRFTDVAKNVNGTWLYIADHASVPLPPE